MRLLVGLVLIIIGAIGIAVGVLYLTQEAHSLPSFFPGYLAHSSRKHTDRGIFGVALGVVLLIIGTIVAVSARRRSTW
jgi:hypothetical protein